MILHSNDCFFDCGIPKRPLRDSTMVVVATEFGRKPQFDGSGRGHHPLVFSCVLAGGGAKRGYVHGASDAEGGHVERDPVTVGDLHATVANACGLPIEQSVISPRASRSAACAHDPAKSKAPPVTLLPSL